VPRVVVDPGLDVESLRAHLDLPVDEGPLTGDDVVGAIAWTRRVGAAELAAMPRLQVVVTPSVGYDHIDLDAARRHGGVHVCHIPDYCHEEMADSALALALALMRGVVVLDRDVRAGGWDAKAAGPLRRIRGTRLGVVGYGRIGAGVARRALALGFEVWAADVREVADASVRPASLEELLRACHVISLHAPLTPETHGLIGAAEIAAMPRGAFLINTARGELVDTDAVVAALASGQLGGAALDVLPVEPPTEEYPAPRADRLIVTPHAAYYSPEAEAELYRRVAEAVRDALAGRTPRGALVSPASAVG
jgi:D-3-phosphoglycerate dehydrogenase